MSNEQESTYKRIKDWTEEERPREKMLQKGMNALTNAELLAILIREGTTNKSAITLAQEILDSTQNDLNHLGRLSLKEYLRIKGIGKAKAITLMAAMELGRRRQLQEGLERKKIISSRDAAAVLMPLLRDRAHEALCVLYLNNAQKLLHYELLSLGGLTTTIVDVKLILRNALHHLAASIVIGHNHPSGNHHPSRNDREITQRLKQAAILLDIRLSDHIIIADNSYYSFADAGDI